jgi:hypothetical protein
MAPGHAYQESQGTGIEWLPGSARLWEQGQVTLEARHKTTSPDAFWYSLAFRDVFPKVTHWWFRSAWTGNVKLSRPDPAMSRNSAIGGWMTFGSDPEQRLPWYVINAQTPVVATPYPPMNVQPVNLPLRVALARLVIGLLQDEITPDAWYPVTSLVRREELEVGFPVSQDAWERTFGRWRIANGEEALAVPLRTALVELQGMTAP